MSTVQGAVDFQADVAVMAANNATLIRNFQRRKKIGLEAHVLLGLSSRVTAKTTCEMEIK